MYVGWVILGSISSQWDGSHTDDVGIPAFGLSPIAHAQDCFVLYSGGGRAKRSVQHMVFGGFGKFYPVFRAVGLA